MTHSKQASKRKRRKTALPVMGVAGVSLALAGGASAISKARAADIASPNIAPPRAVTLDEEEISDVSLATFYVFDKEADGLLQDNVILAQRRCGGCRGCGGVARCGGARCAVARCGVARCAVARCGVARCAVVRCGVGVWGCGGCSCSCCLSWGSCRVC